MSDDRLITSQLSENDDHEQQFRPQVLSDFIGQKQVRENLSVFIQAAKARGDALDHVMFFGPPGLGKTTLSQIVARELGVNFRATAGPVISKAGDLVCVSATTDFRLLGTTALGEPSNATPAFAAGVLYLRTDRHLVAFRGAKE